MRNRCFFLCVFLAAWGCLWVVASAGEMIDNPVYQNWAQFKPDSFVTHKSVTKMDEMTSETEMKQTLKEVTSEKVVIELVTTMTMDDQKMEMPAQSMEYPAKVEKPDESTEAAESEQLDEGTEEIVVKGKKIKTNWVKTQLKQGDMTIISTVWTSNDIPNLTVKMVSEMRGPAESTTEMTLLDFKAEKK